MTDRLSTKDLEQTFRDGLGLDGSRDVLAFVSYPTIGQVSGGPQGVAAALLAVSRTLVMPAFTFQTQVIPQSGPPNNDIVYGTGDAQNARAEIFRPDLPVHPDCGSVAEALRQDAETLRSTHPIYSFVAQGAHAREVLASQTRANPLGPIQWLEAHEGYVLLIGLDQRSNFALHLAAQRAGMRTYVRWALTFDDIEQLGSIPGPADGFNALMAPIMGLEGVRIAQLGLARCDLIPIAPMLRTAEAHLR